MPSHNARSILLTAIAAVFLITLGAGNSRTLAQGAPQRPAGWDEYSHGNDTDPDYSVVLPQDQVNEVRITISPANWQAMLEDMTQLYGEFGANPNVGGRAGGAPGGGGFQGGGGNGNPGNPPAPGNMNFGVEENPIWVNVDLAFGDQVWTNVGMRFKGNSSLRGAWGSGTWKLGFKLDFDEFEDTYPEIDNQRFYGFKQLSFSSNWNDQSLLREKVASDIFREAGVPSPQTAFYAVYVDYGEGSLYFGLYTAVEVVEDTVIQTQFEDDNGNVYKPEGSGATFAEGTFSEESFDKESNASEADYSDIKALFEALHAATRSSDPVTWRSNLEAVFDADGFMRWLAVNTVIQNWDTYGSMAHNYYLYNDPTTGQLKWIPWDFNLSLSAGFGPRGGRGGAGRGQGGRTGTSSNGALDQASIGSDWPLIRFLMDDPVYHGLYVNYVAEVSEGAFEPAKLEATLQKWHDLIAPYAIGDNGEQKGYTFLQSESAFKTALTQLITHVQQRYTAAQEFVSSQ